MDSVSHKIMNFEYEKGMYRMKSRYKFSKHGSEWLKVKDELIFVGKTRLGEEKLLKFIRCDKDFPDRKEFTHLIRNASNNRHRGERIKIYDERDEYEEKIRNMTESINLINIPGIENRGKDFHLDHIFPIKAAFEYKLSINLMSSLSNLQMLPANDNLIKGNKITKESIELVNRWRKDGRLGERIFTEIMNDHNTEYFKKVQIYY